MSTGYQIYDQKGCYYLTFQIVGWVDVFTRQCYRDILIDALRFSIGNKGLKVHAYVVMSNHAHLIVSARDGNLSDLVGGVKSWVARELWNRIGTGPESRREWMQAVFRQAAAAHSRNSQYQIWKHENHAIELHSEAFIRQKLVYIHNNPVRAGWVHEPAHYRYSSAADYLAGKQVGALPVVFLL